MASRQHWLRHHPTPRFVITGGVSALVDTGALFLLHAELGVTLPLSTTLAYACAFVVNFTLSRQWTFPGARQGNPQRQVLRYMTVVAANLTLTLGIVTGLAAVGMYFVLAKLVSIGVIAAGNFFVHRRWVFTA